MTSDVVQTTRASLLSTTKPVNRYVYSDNSDSPVPLAAHLDSQSNLGILDISNIMNNDDSDYYHLDDTIETDGLSHEIDSAEQKAQEEEQKAILEEWKSTMYNNANNFLSDTSIMSGMSRRRRSLSASEIRRRIRRNTEYFYDDYQSVGPDLYNSTFFDMYDYGDNGTLQIEIEIFATATSEPQIDVSIQSDVKMSIKNS